jgi:hypothetical protein
MTVNPSSGPKLAKGSPAEINVQAKIQNNGTH